MSQKLNISGYKIIKEILPPGGWGNVYLAEYKNQKVALKVLKPKLARQPRYVKEFFNEAKLIAKIKSPNVVRIVDIGNQSHPPFYYTMVYYSRGNLENFIKENKILSTEVIVNISVQICNALETINQEGHLHLDLKPSNILFGDNNRVVLTDFGASKRLVLNDKTDEIKGTPQYMSPEQFDNEKELTFASDLYSLGIIMYYMACGQLPFQSSDINKLHILHTTTEPFSLTHHNKKVNKKLEKITLKLLSKKPENRYFNAHSLAEDLQKLVANPKSKQYKILIEKLKSNGKYQAEYRSAKFPVVISNRKDVKNSINLDMRQNITAYTAVGISPNGKILIKDKSNIGTRVAGDLIRNQTKLVNEKTTKLVIGNNRFKVSVIEDRSSFIAKSAVYMISSIIITTILILFLFLSNQSNLKEPKISKLYISETQIWYDEPFSFSFESSLDSSSKISSIIISPFDDEIEIAFPPDNNEFIYTRDLIQKRKNPFNFSVRIMDNNGLYSNWLHTDLTIKNFTDKIQLATLSGIPNRIKIGKKIRYSFETISSLPKDQIYIQIKEIRNNITSRSDPLVLVDELVKERVFREEGEIKLEIRAISMDGRNRSDVLSKTFFVTMDLPNPEAEITYSNIKNNKLRFTCDFSDNYFDNESLQVKLIVNDIGTDFKVTKGLNVYLLERPGSYKFQLQIKSPDGRFGYSKVEEQSY